VIDMATFDKAPQRVYETIREVIEEYYPDLVEANARIGAVFAYPTLDKEGDPTGPAMMKDDRQIMARIKKNSEEDRAAGKDDATITFDAEEWKRLDDEPDGGFQQAALVDHELHHLIVRRELPADGQKVGRIMMDDKGRPLFKMKPHDWEITGFRAVAERHGRHSYERQEARRFHDRFGNLLFNFAEDKASPIDVERAFDEVAGKINDGAMGTGVTAKVNGRKPRGAASVAAARR
jgi:hypothetical protein